MPRKKTKNKATPTCISQLSCFTENQGVKELDENSSERYLKKQSVETTQHPSLNPEATNRDDPVSKPCITQHSDVTLPQDDKNHRAGIECLAKLFPSETVSKVAENKKNLNLLTPATKPKATQPPLLIYKNRKTVVTSEVTLCKNAVPAPVLIRSETNSTSKTQSSLPPQPEKKERGRRRRRYQYTYRERSESSSCDDTMPSRSERGRTRQRRVLPKRKGKEQQQEQQQQAQQWKPQPSTAFSGSGIAVKKETRLSSATGNTTGRAHNVPVFPPFDFNDMKAALFSASRQLRKEAGEKNDCQTATVGIKIQTVKTKRRRAKYKPKDF